MIKILRFSLFIVIMVSSVLGLSGCKPAKPKTENCTDIISAVLCQKIGQLLIVGFGNMDHDDQDKITWNDPEWNAIQKNSYIARDICRLACRRCIYFRGEIRDPLTGVAIRERNIENDVQLAQLSRDLQAYNAKVGLRGTICHRCR